MMAERDAKRGAAFMASAACGKLTATIRDKGELFCAF